MKNYILLSQCAGHIVMKTAIISDSHDNLSNIYKAIGWMNKNKISQIIHCGDVCSPSSLREISQRFKKKIHLVFGNVDGDQFSIGKEIGRGALKNVTMHGDLGEIKIGNKKIAFTHKPYFARALAQTNKYDIVFYGHTHQPFEETIGKCKLINPGTLAGMFSKATFAVYDTETNTFTLKILELIQDN